MACLVPCLEQQPAAAVGTLVAAGMAVAVGKLAAADRAVAAVDTQGLAAADTLAQHMGSCPGGAVARNGLLCWEVLSSHPAAHLQTSPVASKTLSQECRQDQTNFQPYMTGEGSTLYDRSRIDRQTRCLQEVNKWNQGRCTCHAPRPQHCTQGCTQHWRTESSNDISCASEKVMHCSRH